VDYSIIRVRLADCVDLPALAVIVICDVVGFFFDEADDPPHPEKRPSPAPVMSSKRIICRRLRFRKPSKHTATAKVATGSNGREFRLTAVVEPPLIES